MAAEGVYNRNSRVQQHGLIPGMRLLERAAAAVDLPDAPQPILIADYGCSGGRNSLDPVATAIEVLRKFRPATLGQAGRLAGINPADVSLLAIAIKRHRAGTR